MCHTNKHPSNAAHNIRSQFYNTLNIYIYNKWRIAFSWIFEVIFLTRDARLAYVFIRVTYGVGECVTLKKNHSIHICRNAKRHLFVVTVELCAQEWGILIFCRVITVFGFLHRRIVLGVTSPTIPSTQAIADKVGR